MVAHLSGDWWCLDVLLSSVVTDQVEETSKVKISGNSAAKEVSQLTAVRWVVTEGGVASTEF